MILVLVEVVKNISNAVQEKCKGCDELVFIDDLKMNWNAYQTPLVELRDSL